MNKQTHLGIALCAGVMIAVATLPVNAQQLTGNEARATQISGEWQHRQGVVTHGADGKVIFLYGEVQPSVVCSPLQVCDIELQAGEVVRDVLLGDTVRWKVEPATSGAPSGQAIHLIVKPSEAGLVTSMVVTTSRRTYHIQLKSHHSQYMARVGFDYPEDINARFAEINARIEGKRRAGRRRSGRSTRLWVSYERRGALAADADLQRRHEDLHPVSVLPVRAGGAGPVRRLRR
jgi:type IV secretory pathway VirB9-like protein